MYVNGMNVVLATDGLLGDTVARFMNSAGLDSTKVRSFLDDLEESLQGADFFGDIAVATDIENIIGVQGGTSTVRFINGAKLQGTVSAGLGGSIILDYSGYRSPDETAGITTNLGAGIDFSLPLPSVPLLGQLDAALVYGSAEAVEGNRFGGIEQLFKLIPGATDLHNFGVVGGIGVGATTSVVGTQNADHLTGNKLNIRFTGKGGADVVDGGSGEDSFGFGRADASVIDLATGRAAYGVASADGRLHQSTLTQSSVDTPERQKILIDATSGSFQLLYNGERTTSILYNASAPAVEEALEALAGVKNVTVTALTGGETGWQVEFTAQVRAQALDKDLSALKKGSAAGTLAISTTREGSSAVTVNLANSATAGSFKLAIGAGGAGLLAVGTGPNVTMECFKIDTVFLFGNVHVTKALDANSWTISFDHTHTWAPQVYVQDIGLGPQGSLTTLASIQDAASGAGNDLLVGEAGANRYYFTENSGHDVVIDVSSGGAAGAEDILDFSKVSLGYGINRTVDGPLTHVDIYNKVTHEVVATVDAYNVERVKGVREIGDTLTGVFTRKAGIGSGLEAADVTSADTLSSLTQAQVDAVVQEAIRLWQRAGAPVDGAFDDFVASVADLPGQLLGATQGDQLTFDVDAAGAGWFIDAAPPGAAAATEYDLLTVRGAYDPKFSALMSASLEPGIRKDAEWDAAAAAGAAVDAHEETPPVSDEQKLETGLEAFGDWAANFGGSINNLFGPDFPSLPFVDSVLSQVWSVTGAGITGTIKHEIEDQILGVFHDATKPLVTVADILALPGISATDATNAKEFSAHLTLKHFGGSVNLNFDPSDFGGVPLSVAQSTPVSLDGDVLIDFTF